MTDREKLDYIEKIARECFSEEWRNALPHVAEVHRAQVLAYIFLIFEYDGLTIGSKSEERPEDDSQITFDDIL